MKLRSLTLLAITAFIGLFIPCTLTKPDGFLSINCGASKNDTIGELDWITDSLFIKFRNTSIMPPFSSNDLPYQYRFPQDQYDRMWKPFPVPLTTSISTNESSFRSVKNQPPVSVLKTAITSRVGEELLISEWFNAVPGIYYFALYLCNINKTSVSGNNTFQVFIGNVQIAETEVPEYMYCSSPETRLELSTTDSTDIRILLAIRNIANTVNVPDDWTTGDPCLPAGLPLTGVMCNDEDTPRVITVNLTSMGLTGNIPPSIANLTALQQLNNKLDGDVPPGLIKPGLNLEVHPQNKPPQGRKDKDKDDPNEFEKVVVEYSEEDIKAATNNYSTLIGKGGFESVFYGQLSGNNVAVKILSTDSSQGKQEFRIEVLPFLRNIEYFIEDNDFILYLILLYQLKLQVIVALVYEFMECGTLADHLHGSMKQEKPLDWQTRINIALQTAQGLLYLHEGCIPSIVHRDIKCTNILLDNRMFAKIADFGLSKLLQNSQSHVTTEFKGTLGYLDPKYYGTSSLNEKSDVYSFGVVLLEIISGIPPKEGIVESAKELLSCGRIAELMDSSLGGHYSLESAWRVAEVAYNCVEPRPQNRPTMNTVVKELAEAKALVLHDDIKPASLNVLDEVPEPR
ncbi:hypothetical protein SUGI_0066240 [Cryptomeria japonica]|nr:hypothetical protein SUGI_0066240 [Cryptomeria japonica]